MRRVFSAAACLFLIALLTACGSRLQSPDVPPIQPDGGTEQAGSQLPVPQEEDAEPEPGPEPEGTRILVAYFSATGTTKALAESTAEVTGADLYEIIPEQPYTAEDLDYGDAGSRTSQEQNEESARPGISGGVENMEQYDIIFLGYPIWWGEAPRIVATFVESYDWAGKTVVPFCTSGSSGIGDSAVNLQELAPPDALWLAGERLGGDSTREEIAAWISGLGLEGLGE